MNGMQPGGTSRHRFDPSILREYDIRGIWGETLGAADAHAVGRSFATIVRRSPDVPENRRPRVVVGRDGRLSSPQLEEGLVAGLCEGGVDVVRIGLSPSPMLYFAECSIEETEGGIQVTGSHNPRDHNGFKIVLHGAPFFGAALGELGRIAQEGDWLDNGSIGPGLAESRDVSEGWLDALVSGLNPLGAGAEGHDLAVGLKAMRIGWDCGNGASGPVVERLVRRLPGEHHVLFSDVDGRFPNHHPDPTIEANLADLRSLVLANKLDFGLAFDGDADRLGVIDGKGRVVWADQLLSIFASDVLAANPGAAVVGDVKMSSRVFGEVEERDGTAIMARSGHSPIKAAMKQHGALLGGEMSGHFFFADRYLGFDDGIYAAIRLIAATIGRGLSLTALVDAMPETFATPELRFPVAAERRLAVVEEVAARLDEAGAQVSRIDGVRVTCSDGWWLLRASNTQDMLTARAESHNSKGLQRLVDTIDAQLALSGVRR